MGQHILDGNPPVRVYLRRSAQARRISLRVSGLDAKVTLTLPRGVAKSEAVAFAEEKADWLRLQLRTTPQANTVGPGTELPCEGELLRVVQGSGRRIRMEHGEILVPGNPDSAGARLAGHLKQLARTRLSQASDRYAAALGQEYHRLTLRDTRSRWGSCSSAGALMYSWRLIMAPPEVLTYVAAHEVAHLRHMNHSATFWKEVENLYGDYDVPRAWLRDNGAKLHRFRFGN
ncbi:M48 family metallopeptidase [Thalassovita gelatinovora]|nr:SprT family zinc-dependent metalloprotease [Thalassovita gelatinovora]QIZ82515.1 M48 family metallopeptidase [Thalassovita gelatinovora]